MELILTLDVGSSSIRCTAYSVVGTHVNAVPDYSASCKFRAVTPTTGKIRLQDGSETFFDKIDGCITAVLDKMGESDDVIAVGFSSFVMNFVAVDKAGNPLGEDFTMSYACNSPLVAQECQRIREEISSPQLEALYDQTGAPIHSAYAVAQLREMYRSLPQQQLQKIHKWQTLASLCIAKWTGMVALPISFSEASWSGLLDFRNCCYSPDALNLLPSECRSALPALTDFSTPLQGLPKTLQSGEINSYSHKWPKLQKAQFFFGIGDGACANIGSKCSTTSRIAITIGTSAAARICVAQGIGPACTLEKVPKGLFCYRVDRKNLLIGGALTDGGSIVEWVSQLLNLRSDEDFKSCLDQVEELAKVDYNTSTDFDERKLITLPFLSGERSTGYRSGASGAIVGITRNTTGAHLLKSSLEGVSLRLRAIVALILQSRGSTDDPCIVVSGKSMEVNALWRQMVADSCKLRVLLDLDTHEGTSRGVARLLAVALQEQKLEKELELGEEELALFETSTPSRGGQAFFDRAANAQNRFLDVISPLFED